MLNEQQSALADYVDIRTLAQLVVTVFPTVYSVQWFCRNHRTELAESGAMIRIGSTLRFHPDRFQQVAIRVGRERALASTA